MTYSNHSLNWSIQKIDDKQHALQFVQRVGQCMCVTSPIVNQMYSNFQVEADFSLSELTITPNFDKHLEIFDFIDSEAISKTNIMILPHIIAGKEQLCMGLIDKKTEQLRLLPLRDGLQKIKRQNPDFLPVLNSREVRQWRPGSPMLQVYQLNLKSLKGQSPFVLKDIQNTINDKLAALSAVA